ncbi:MAG TPA: hypothetical protein VGD52_00830 [Pseudoduganella sp.]
MPHISSSSISLNPGAYVLRHPGNGLAPLALARSPAVANNHGTLQTIATAGDLGLMLRDASDCVMLLVARGPVELLVSAYLERADSPMPKLRLDRIALEALPAAAAATPAPAPTAAPAALAPAAPQPAPVTTSRPITIGPHGISLIGHIQAVGDKVAAMGEFLGDPNANLRLEGFQAAWPDRPEGVDLSYGVTLEGMAPTANVLSGKFCGTRNEARRITEVRFDLVGPQAKAWRLEGSAHFSGGYQMPLVPGMALSGPSGCEHLTALTLRAVPSATPGKAASAWDASARTTVFKAAQAAPKRKGKK